MLTCVILNTRGLATRKEKKMKTIRISNEAYKFLKFKADIDKRSLVATLDLFVEIFKEGNDEGKEELAQESLSTSKKRKD